MGGAAVQPIAPGAATHPSGHGVVCRVLVAAGYGGHAGFGFAIGYSLARRGIDVEFLAVGDSWLAEKLSRVGRVHPLPLPRRPGEPLARGLHRWPAALARTLRLSGGYKALVATGSNFSLPPALAGRIRGVPVYSLEDAVRIVEPSRAAMIIHRLRLAKVTMLQWPEQARFYPRRSILVGPVYEPRLHEPRDEGYVLVTAGTVGNRELLDAVVRASIKRAVVQTGRVDPGPYRAARPEWLFLRYTSDLDRLIAGASAIVAQFGMTAMTARLAYGKPVVIVPARHVKTAAGPANARPYAEKIGAVYIEEVTPKSIEEALEDARKLPVPQHEPGAERVAELVARECRA